MGSALLKGTISTLEALAPLALKTLIPGESGCETVISEAISSEPINRVASGVLVCSHNKGTSILIVQDGWRHNDDKFFLTSGTGTEQLTNQWKITKQWPLCCQLSIDS